MGTGFSAVCASKRSVVIANSICAIRKEQQVGTEEQHLEPSKLHPCVSRDSGIAENEIPHHLCLSRTYLDEEEIKDDTGPESDVELSDNVVDEPFKPSRPHSCRLGNRKATQNRRSADVHVTEDKLVRYVRKTKSSGGNSFAPLIDDDDVLDREDSFYKGYRSKSAVDRRRKNKRAKTADSRRTPLVDDLAFSSEDNESDSEFWTIPDETYNSSRDKGASKKGWVLEDELVSSGASTPTASKSTDILDYCRIVQESYNRYDTILAKKASERSISSIILLPADVTSSPAQSRCSSGHVDTVVLPAQLQQVTFTFPPVILNLSLSLHIRCKMLMSMNVVLLNLRPVLAELLKIRLEI